MLVITRDLDLVEPAVSFWHRGHADHVWYTPAPPGAQAPASERSQSDSSTVVRVVPIGSDLRM